MTLKQILHKYLKDNPGWHRKVQLYLVADSEEYSPESCGRELRFLEEEGLIFVEYYKGKRKQKLAKYCAVTSSKPSVIIRDGIAYIQ